MGWYYDGMARCALVGVQPSEYQRMTPGTVNQLLERVERYRNDARRADHELLVEGFKVVCKQIAEGDRAVMRQVAALGDVLVASMRVRSL